MRLGFRLKHYFFSAFRELFVHHHGSLEFRAKIFALVIAANDEATVENYRTVKDIGMDIYKDDTDRVNLLIMSTKEMVQKVKDGNGLNLDTLVANIQKELKIVPRYAKKIDTQALQPFLSLSCDEDTAAYQKNILSFLQTLKDETLKTKEN